eukprot:1218990-Rhodomonas_salina.3
MSGTDIGYLAGENSQERIFLIVAMYAGTYRPTPSRCEVRYSVPIVLRAPIAMSRPPDAMSRTQYLSSYALPTRCPVLTQGCHIGTLVLRDVRY